MSAVGHFQPPRRTQWLYLLTLCLLTSPSWSAETGPGTAGLTLPPQIETTRLIDLVGEIASVSIHYDPQKISGSIRLDLRQDLAPADAWSIFNQVLLNRGLTTVIAGSPAIYHVVPVSEAEATGMIFTASADAEAITPPPGYLTLVLTLKHVQPELAIQALSSVLGQKAQARTVGREDSRLVLVGDRERVLAGQRLLVAIDRPGNQVGFRAYQPQYASAGKLQASFSTAWAAASKVSGHPSGIEIQTMPDGQRLLVVATTDDLAGAIQLLADLDRAEPAITRTYRFEHFRLDDVAQLIEQLFANDDRLKLVRDHLTGSLMVTATDTQQQRVERLLNELRDAPSGSRQSLRSFVIKHRQASDLANVLKELTTNGAMATTITGAAANVGAPTAATDTNPAAPARSATSATAQQASAGGSNRGGGNTGSEPGSGANDASFTVDAHTNSIIVLGPPRFIDQVAKLVNRLDRRQPQVEVEVTLVSLSDSDSLTIGTEWARIHQSGDRTLNLSQLFGLSTQGANVTDRKAAGTGLTSLVINPGNYAALVQLLATVNHGRNVVTSRSVIDNNAEASIDAVLQQPIANINSNNNIASTSYGGTSDAGTQIKIKPLIGAADQVQLTFSISQSAFVGQSSSTEGGGVIPPPKRQDSLSSTVSVPDGHVIALGGLSNDNSSRGSSGIPWLSSIPLLGYLFSSRSNDTSSSRFYLFIRADVLRHQNYEDLRMRAQQPSKEAGAPLRTGPTPTPRFLE